MASDPKSHLRLTDPNKLEELKLSKDYAEVSEEVLGLSNRRKNNGLLADDKADATEVAINEVLANKIKRLRKKNNLTQQELGDRLGVKKAQISRLESSTANMTMETLHKIAMALGTKISDILLGY